MSRCPSVSLPEGHPVATPRTFPAPASPALALPCIAPIDTCTPPPACTAAPQGQTHRTGFRTHFFPPFPRVLVPHEPCLVRLQCPMLIRSLELGSSFRSQFSKASEMGAVRWRPSLFHTLQAQETPRPCATLSVPYLKAIVMAADAQVFEGNLGTVSDLSVAVSTDAPGRSVR